MDSLKTLSDKIDIFNKERDWDQFHSPANLAKSISIEANEKNSMKSKTRLRRKNENIC